MDLKKSQNPIPQDLSTKLKHIITSIGGRLQNQKTIREFVDEVPMLARDARALRKHIRRISNQT